MASYDAKIRVLADTSSADKAVDRLQQKVQNVERAANRLQAAADKVRFKVEGVSEAERAATRLYKSLERLENATLSKLPKSVQLLVAYLKAANVGVGELASRAALAALGIGEIGRVNFAPLVRQLNQVKDLLFEIQSVRIKFLDAPTGFRPRLEGGNPFQKLLDGLDLVKVRVIETERLLTGLGNTIKSLRGDAPTGGGRGGRGGGGGGGGGRRPGQNILPPDFSKLIDDATTLKGLRNIRRELENLLETTTIGTGAFRKYEDQIAQINEKIKDAQLLGQRGGSGVGSNRNKARGLTGKFRDAATGFGFSALFGGGPGEVLGGGLGGLGIGGIGGGLAGSLIGSVIGRVFDDLSKKAANIGSALQNATSNMEGLRDSGINVTAELEAQVRLLNRYGAAQTAQQRVEQAVALQTGDIGGQGTRLAAGSANELQKAFEGVSAAAATTIGIIGAPFAQAITAILRGVQAILVVFNAVITAATGLINLIPGAKALGDALFESSLKGTAEYEKRQRLLDEETETLTRTVKEQQKYNDALRSAGQLRNTDFKLSKQLLDYRAKERQAVEAVLDKQQELGGGRTPEERARIEATLSAFRTLQNEKLTKERLENEREIITAQENNVKKINDINESTAKTYRDMRIKLERQIEDERINAIRRIQDAQLKSEKAVIDFREKELKLIQDQRRERLEVSAALGQLEASFTAAPGREGIAAQLTAAVAQYKNGIIEADENRKLTEAKIQLDAKEAALAVERFKQDNARRVARINEDSARKIAEVNNRLDKQRNESFKYAYDLTVKRLIAQETAAKGQIEQSIAGQRALMSSPFASEAFKQESAARIGGLQAEIQSIEVTISRLQNLMSKLPQTPSIQGMGGLPSLTPQANEVSAAETALNSVLQKGRERLSQLTQENSEKSAAAKLALEGISLVSTAAAKQANITNSLNEGNRETAQYIELLKSGVNPELAKQRAAITSASIGVENVIDQTVQQLEALNNPEFKELIDKLLELKGKQGSIVADQTEAAKESQRFKDEEEKIKKIKAISEDLEKNVFKRLGTALEDALVGTIEAAVTGAKDLQETLQEIASSLLKDVGRMFIRAAISGAGTQLKLPGFADGGFAQPGRSYIVGERGPELLTMSASGGYVTNNSASQAAMDRYSSGNTRGGSISVNYNVTDINGMRFVTEDQFRAGVAQAAKQGADGGFNRTMSSLKNSRSTRSRVGV